MDSGNDKSFPVFSLVYNAFAVPYNFFLGFIVGLAAPLAAIAAAVYGVRFVTGRMPFLHLSQEAEEEERHLSIELVSPDQVGELFEAEKEKVSGELANLQAEIKAIIEEARAEGREAAGQEEGGPAEA